MIRKKRITFHNGIPELYYATLIVNNYYHWGYLFHGVRVELVRVPDKKKTFSREDFEKMIVYDNLDDQEIEILETQIEEHFTKEEIEMMELLLAYHDGWDTILRSTKVQFPLKKTEKSDICPRTIVVDAFALLAPYDIVPTIGVVALRLLVEFADALVAESVNWLCPTSEAPSSLGPVDA